MILPDILIALFFQLTKSASSQPEPNFFTEHNLTILGSIVSIISFFLTVFVLYDTRKLRGFYRFRGRGPTLIRDLRLCSQNISEFLNEFDDFLPQIAEELGRAIAKLKSLERKLRGPTKTSAKRLRRHISRFKIDAGTEGEVREIYVEMIKVIEEIIDYQRDLDWEL